MKTLRWVGIAVAVAAVMVLIGTRRPAGAQQPAPTTVLQPAAVPVQVPPAPAAAPVQFVQPTTPLVVPAISTGGFFVPVGDTYINMGRIDYVRVRDDTVEVYMMGREDPVELRRRDVDASRLFQIITPGVQ
ncbi:MAG TPA: hypothetical protein VF590_15270 [Isosphaeraceae bacterium]|jgi:hypothetical protein